MWASTPSFKCNDKIMAAINDGGEYGIELQVNDGEKGEYVFNDPVTKENVNPVETMGITEANAADYLAASQKVNAYIKLGETKITSSVKETSVKALVLGVLAKAEMTESERTCLETLYENHKAVLDDWNEPSVDKLNKAS